MSKNTHVIVDNLYETVVKSLKKSVNYKAYKNNIDLYLSRNASKYTCLGPSERPIFSQNDINNYLTLCGLDEEIIFQTLKKTSKIKSNWEAVNKPMNIANVLATRYFAIKKDDEYENYSRMYMIVSTYPRLNYKYFSHGVNEQTMEYTINNLSRKYRIKQSNDLWTALQELIKVCYDGKRDRIIKGDDDDFISYINDCYNRMNMFLREISIEYYDNNKEGRSNTKEHESNEEEDYYVSNSNSFEVENISNKVTTHLLSNGPNMRLVQLAANQNQVSVNKLRTYLQGIIHERNRAEIYRLIENILSLYLIANETQHRFEDVKSTDFIIYCLKLYKKANTGNEKIIDIKDILNKWLVETGTKFVSPNTENSFKKALFCFFVFTVNNLS